MYREGMKLAARLEEEEAALRKELQVLQQADVVQGCRRAGCKVERGRGSVRAPEV